LYEKPPIDTTICKACGKKAHAISDQADLGMIKVTSDHAGMHFYEDQLQDTTLCQACQASLHVKNASVIRDQIKDHGDNMRAMSQK